MNHKPDVTLQPTKGVLTEAAARIYAAYIIGGCVKEEEAEHWIRRSIREAVTIARTVDKSVQSDSELPAEQPVVHRPAEDVDDSTSGKPNLEEVAEEALLEHASPPPSAKPNQSRTRTKRDAEAKANVNSSENAAQAASDTLQQIR